METSTEKPTKGFERQVFEELLCVVPLLSLYFTVDQASIAKSQFNITLKVS